MACIVAFEQHQKQVQAAQARAAAAQQAREQATTQKLVLADKLQHEVDGLQQVKQSVCTYIASLPKSKAVTVPPVCEQ